MVSGWKESRRNNPSGIISSYEDFQFSKTRILSSKSQIPIRQERQQQQHPPDGMDENSCVSGKAADSLQMKFDNNSVFSVCRFPFFTYLCCLYKCYM